MPAFYKKVIISLLVLPLFPGNVLFSGDDSIRKDFKKGIEYTNQGKYDEAIKKFTQVITNEKDYANAYLALGIVYINKKMDNEAVELLVKAIELDPSNMKAHFILAKLYEKLDEEEKAMGLWERVLMLDPEEKQLRIAEKHLERLKGKR